ncbi:MAG: hypothetical protein ABH851_05255 [Methanobacteriota archaeon]
MSQAFGEDIYAKCFVSTRIEEMCSLLDGGYKDLCEDLTVMPWSVVDDVFQDDSKHHDYSLCPVRGFAAGYLCGSKEDAPAKVQAENWFTKSKNLAGECTRLYAFCIGADYYSKRFFQPYQITIENEQCVEYFKSNVDEVIWTNGDWSVRNKCVYEYWEPRAGQSKKVSHPQDFIVTDTKIASILDGLIEKANEIKAYDGEILLGSEIVETSTTSVQTTSTTTSTTTTPQSTTTTIDVEESSSTSLKPTTTSVEKTSTSTTSTSLKVGVGMEEETQDSGEFSSTSIFAIIFALVFGVVFAIFFLYIRVLRRSGGDEDVPPPKPVEKSKMEYSLTDIEGIGRVAQDRLRYGGVDSLEKLAEMDIDWIVENTGISEERIGIWRMRARQLLSK